MDGSITISTASIVWALTAFVGFFGREGVKFVFEKLTTRSSTIDQTRLLEMKELIRETVDESVSSQLEKSVLPIMNTISGAVDKLANVNEKIHETLVKLTTIAEERRPQPDYLVPRRRRK